jgi:hypothetical protein
MQTPKRPRRKTYQKTDDFPIDELTEAMIEILGEEPVKARAAKARADAEGLSLDAWWWKTVANGLYTDGVPLPPKIRKHIAEHPDMPEALRRKLLTRDLN